MSRTASAAFVQLVRRTNPWLESPATFVTEAERRQPASWIARHLAGSERWPVKGRAHLVVGARQVGKTSWLWRRLVEAGQVPLALDGAEPIVQEWASSPGLAAADLRALVQPGTPILLDEAQHLDEAGLLIKGLIDSGVPGPLYVTGSSSFHLLARTRESLAGRAVRAEMHPEHAPVAGHQDLQIAQRLRRLHHTERVGTSGNLQIGRVVGGDLQKHPRRRSSLEDLPRRVEKPRSEPDTGRDPGCVSDHVSQPVERHLLRIVPIKIRQEREIVART